MKLSLHTKILFLVLAVAIVLSATATITTYTFYRETQQQRAAYTAETLAKAEALALDRDAVATLTDAVMTIYREQVEKYGGSIPFAEFSEEEREEYYSAFFDVYAMPEFVDVSFALGDIEASGDLYSTYLSVMDRETDTEVYIVFSAQDSELFPGACEDIVPQCREWMADGIYDFPAYVAEYDGFGHLMSAATGIYDDEGNIIAEAFVDISMDYELDNSRRFLQKMSVYLLAITVLAIGCSMLLVDTSMVKPLNRLAGFTSSFVENNYRSNETISVTDLKFHSGDEIGKLYESVGKMHVDIQDYMRDLTAATAEKERISTELNVAKQIQSDLLPSAENAFSDRKEFDIYASMNPAKEVGGDFYDFFMIDDDHLGLVIGDVSGKGVPAALFMVCAKTILWGKALMGDSPKEILKTANEMLCQNNNMGMFVTVWLGIMEISTGKVIAANAGHEYPVIRKKDGSFELLRDQHDFVLAGIEESRYHEYEFTVEEGGTLFLYTDGVAEAMNEENELFGTDRLLTALNRDPTGTPRELTEQVLDDINEFTGETPQFDDITILCLKRRESGTSAE